MARFTLISALALAATALVACGDDGDAEESSGTELNCDLGNEITAEFDAIQSQGEPPTPEQFEDIKAKVTEFGKPEGIEDEVQEVLDSIDVFVEELAKGADFDQERLGAAAEASNAAGETIEAFLEENCS